MVSVFKPIPSRPVPRNPELSTAPAIISVVPLPTSSAPPLWVSLPLGVMVQDCPFSRATSPSTVVSWVKPVLATPPNSKLPQTCQIAPAGTSWMPVAWLVRFTVAP